MGLATPAAIMAGSNAAAQRGILIRDGVALEKAGRVTAVLFDKTGTLTVGKPEVVRGVGEGRSPKPETRKPKEARRPKSEGRGRKCAWRRRWLAILLIRSARRWRRLSPNGLVLADWQEVRGAGVQARVEADRQSPIANQGGRLVTARLGSMRWLEESGVDLAPGKAFIADWASQGATIVGLAVEELPARAVRGEGCRQAWRPRRRPGTSSGKG